MKTIMRKDDFISEIAKRSRFTKSDVSIILETIIEIFSDCVRDNIILKVRGFGRLYVQLIPPRKGSKGQQLPESTRAIFKLAETIRHADKDENLPLI